MNIESIDCTLPSNKIDNLEILDLIKFYNKNHSKEEIYKIQKTVTSQLNNCGIETRYWRNSKEKPINLIHNSFENLMSKSNINKSQIDTLIYVSVDRGFIEPANACFVAKKLGLLSVRTFDIVDACMGWCTALQLSQALLKNLDAKYILIVSSECPMDNGGVILPKNFKINSYNELKWKFPAYTLGEAVTTTLLENTDLNWKFHFNSNADKADLCTIPLHKYAEYSDLSLKLKNKEGLSFSAYGRELYFFGYKEALRTLKEGLVKCKSDPKLILPHSVSSRVPLHVEQKLNLEKKMFTTFPRIGNVATSSIPANIYYAKLSKKVIKGDNLLGWIASGGLKYSAFDIYI